MARNYTEKEKKVMSDAKYLGENIAKQLYNQNKTGDSLKLFDYKVAYLMKSDKQEPFIQFMTQYFNHWQEEVPAFVINSDWEFTKDCTCSFISGLYTIRLMSKNEKKNF